MGSSSLRTILATEQADCGLACLAMIADYFGDRVELVQLRQAFPVSANGINLAALMKVADALELNSRALRVELDALTHVTEPIILHWNFNHFVVFERMHKGCAVIHDPAVGKRHLSLAEVSNHFTGVLLELSPRVSFARRDRRVRLRLTDLWSANSGLWRAAFQIIAMSLLLQVLLIVPSLQLQAIVDQVTANGGTDLITVIGVAFGAAVCFQVCAAAMRDWMIQVTGASVVLQLSSNIYSHLLRLPISWFEKRHTGDVISRLTGLESLRDMISRGLISVVMDSISIVITAAFLFRYSLVLLSIVLIFATAGIVVGSFASQVAVKRSMEALVAAAVEQTHILETLRAMATIKTMGKEGERLSRWKDLAVNAVNAGLSAAKVNTLSAAVISGLSGLQTVVVLCVGAFLVQKGDGFSLGMLMAFYALSQVFSERLRTAAGYLIQLRVMRLHLDRLADIVLEPAESGAATSTDEPLGEMECRHISFRYGASDPWILRDVNLRFAAGEFVAIMGPSGAGKSTLVRILLGLLEPTRGEVILDGDPATTGMWRRWRMFMGVVSQADTLFSGTLYDNIALFDPASKFEDVESAAQQAHIHDDIVRLPLRYQTRVGDMGASLSAGQKQRLMLARALFRKPRVLILDEGTANLDHDNEDGILRIIKEMEITRIIVTHKIEVAGRADRIVRVVDGGRLEFD